MSDLPSSTVTAVGTKRRVALAAVVGVLALGSGAAGAVSLASSGSPADRPAAEIAIGELQTVLDDVLRQADVPVVERSASPSTLTEKKTAGLVEDLLVDLPPQGDVNGYRLFVSGVGSDDGQVTCESARAMGAIACRMTTTHHGVLLDATYVHVQAKDLGPGKYTLLETPLSRAERANLRVQHVVALSSDTGGRATLIETLLGPSSEEFVSQFRLSSSGMAGALATDAVQALLGQK